LHSRGKVNQISFSQQRQNQPNENLNGLRKETQALKEGQRTIREALRKVRDRVKERPATTQPRPRRFVLSKSLKFWSAAKKDGLVKPIFFRGGLPSHPMLVTAA
jgi:hypothetical protein